MTGAEPEEPTGRLPAAAERFRPGRASLPPPLEPEPVSALPVTSRYPDSFAEPGPVAVAYPVGSARGYVVAAAPTNGMAVASLICSIIGLFTCFVMSLVGAILGHVGRRQIRDRGQAGDGLALAGIILGWAGVALLAVCGAGLLIYAASLGAAAPTGP